MREMDVSGGGGGYEVKGLLEREPQCIDHRNWRVLLVSEGEKKVGR